MYNRPLADRIRPNTLEEIYGQEHLTGKGKILWRMIKSDLYTNMIFYGPPGIGKTTVANIIAKKSNKKLHRLNATNCGVKDIQNIAKNIDSLLNTNGILLYLDEIQNFNKKQQQSLLEYIENGSITLIASTTENPYHYIYKALLSRSTIFEFKALKKDDIKKGIRRAISICQQEFEYGIIEITDEAVDYFCSVSNGDMRKSINALELAIYSTDCDESNKIFIDLTTAVESSQVKVVGFDKKGDDYYDVLSAFQKSIRGSDPDASMHYLARLIMAGDLLSICRRLLVIASEDIGLAYPNAISIVKSCVDSAVQLGFPEARIPLAQAVLLLSLSPKSNSIITAVDSALIDIEKKDIGSIPEHLKDSHYKGAAELGRGENYKYPHKYDNNYIEQQYLPDALKKAIYYKAGANKYEQRYEDFIKRIKNNDKNIKG